MATMEKSANFSGKSWGGYCQLTYTAGNGAITISDIKFKATSSTSASYDAHYDNNQTITIRAGSKSTSKQIAWVLINSTSYKSARDSYGSPSGSTITPVSFSGLNGATTVSFTVRARSSSPYNLTFSYTIDAGSAVTVPSVSGLSVSATDETTITASFNITSNGGATATGHITCNGQTVNSTSATFTGLTSGTQYTVEAHASNSAGNSNYLYAYPTTYYYPHVTGCTSANIGQPFTLVIYNPLGRTYTAERISLNNNQVIGSYTGTINGNLTRFDSQGDIDAMYASIPNTPKGQYKTRVTYSPAGWVHDNDNRGKGEYYAVQADCSPTFENFTWEDINATTLALTGDSSIVVNGYSNIQATIPVADKMTAKNSASPRRYEFICGSNPRVDITYSSSSDVSGTQQKVKSNTFQVRAVDTREFPSDYVTKTASNYINYADMTKSSGSISRVGEVGQAATLSYEGTFWNDDFGAVTNTIKSATYKYKTGSGDWQTGSTDITPTVNGNNFSFTGQIAGDIPNVGFDVQNVYTIVVTIEDELSSVEWTLTLNSGTPHLAWHKNGLSIMGKYNTNSGGKLQIAGVNIFDLIYPVGSICIRMDSTDPATLFGVGTWERLSGGFLYGAVNNSGNGNGTGTSTNNYTGNTGAHAISWNEMPAHTHDRGTMEIYGAFRTRPMTNGTNIAESVGGAFGHVFDGGGASWWTGLNGTSLSSAAATDLIDFYASRYWTGNTGNAGASWGHDHTMTHSHAVPYMAVFVWKRTA